MAFVQDKWLPTLMKIIVLAVCAAFFLFVGGPLAFVAGAVAHGWFGTPGIVVVSVVWFLSLVTMFAVLGEGN